MTDKKGSKSVLKALNNEEILSYIINVTPELRDDIDLPIQGQSIKPIGKIIINNERYKNAFLNTINLLAETVIKRNGWDNPWDWFTNRGTISFGQQIREIIVDLCNVYDYNKKFDDKTWFLETRVPNIFQYIHEVNFQKIYPATTTDARISMAFDTEEGLFTLIDEIIGMLYESLKYDKYCVDKYMLCRRILDGTVTPSYIEIENKYTREIVSEIKAISNKMTFRSPNFNPAGVRLATPFDEQILIVSTDFEAQFSTEVLATSFFRDEADMRSRLALCDGFGNHDIERLTEVLEEAFIAFTPEEIAQLEKIPAVLISSKWFMDYAYNLNINSEGGVKFTDFYNPATLENHHFLHYWGVFSTSPFENASVFTDIEGSVTSVTVSPDTATLTTGAELQFTAIVDSTGFVNKAVTWSVDNEEIATIDNTGKLKALSAGTVIVTATSVYDKTITGTATIEIS